VEVEDLSLFETVELSGPDHLARKEKWKRGNIQYELTNHLGNVLVTVSDRKHGVVGDSEICDDGYYFTCYFPYVRYEAEIVTANDYYPFGMGMPGRKYAADGAYRYGFNGKENDNDVKGEGNQQDYGFRIYDPRLGRFLSVDPLTKNYPMLTPYQFASNRPIQGIDLEGLEFFTAADCYIRLSMNYNPELKKVTGGSVSFRYTHPDAPAGLEESLKNRTVNENSIGIDATVATFVVPIAQVLNNATTAEIKDTDDESAIGMQSSVTLPIVPQNNTQRREQLKTRKFTEEVSTLNATNNTRLNVIGAAIEVVTISLKVRQNLYYESYMNRVKFQAEYTSQVVSIIQYGIDNNIITNEYRDNYHLTMIANHLLNGEEIWKTQWNEKGNKWEYPKDEVLTKIAKSLWDTYDTANKLKQMENQREQNQLRQRASTDNTRVNH
jgi:RHS repeat-associated protein